MTPLGYDSKLVSEEIEEPLDTPLDVKIIKEETQEETDHRYIDLNITEEEIEDGS